MLAAPAVAQARRKTAPASYPNRPVRIIVPFPAGGPTDILARVIAQRLSEVWGQPVVIENQPGANTAIARSTRGQDAGRRLHAARRHGRDHGAQPGHQQAICPTIRSRISRPSRSRAKNTSLLTVRAADGPKTVKELIARAKASPGKLNYGAGIITTRLAGYLFNARPASRCNTSRSTAAPRPCRACSPARRLHRRRHRRQPAADPGRPVARRSPSSTAGRCRPCRMCSRSRSPPSCPRSRISRPGSASSHPPARRPRSSTKSSARSCGCMPIPPWPSKLERSGINAVTSTPAEFDAFFRKETERWAKVFKDSGIRLD